MRDRNFNIDLIYFKNADQEKLQSIILQLCDDNDGIIKEMNYLTERYKPNACKNEMNELRKKLFSNTSLMVLLSDLRDQIMLCNIEQQALNLCHTNSKYGEESPIPSQEKEVIENEKM